MDIYNKKEFLSPNSIWSMAAFHAAIHDDGICILRISDCKNSIKIWNDFNEPSQIIDMKQCLMTLSEGISELISFIDDNYLNK